MTGLGLLSDDIPVVICNNSQVLKNPSTKEVAECLGFNSHIDDSQVRDLIIVGAGPAGLAAAVYAASEGLDVLVVEKAAPGGQAGSSSKIENYLGFPTGALWPGAGRQSHCPSREVWRTDHGGALRGPTSTAISVLIESRWTMGTRSRRAPSFSRQARNTTSRLFPDWSLLPAKASTTTQPTWKRKLCAGERGDRDRWRQFRRASGDLSRPEYGGRNDARAVEQLSCHHVPLSDPEDRGKPADSGALQQRAHQPRRRRTSRTCDLDRQVKVTRERALSSPSGMYSS